MQRNREETQALAKKLGHCCCSKEFQCECKWFKDKGQCHCAGEDGGVNPFNFDEWLEYNRPKKENLTREKLLALISDLKSKQYEPETILESVVLNLTFNKFEEDEDYTKGNDVY